MLLGHSFLTLCFSLPCSMEFPILSMQMYQWACCFDCSLIRLLQLPSYQPTLSSRELGVKQGCFKDLVQTQAHKILRGMAAVGGNNQSAGTTKAWSRTRLSLGSRNPAHSPQHRDLSHDPLKFMSKVESKWLFYELLTYPPFYLWTRSGAQLQKATAALSSLAVAAAVANVVSQFLLSLPVSRFDLSLRHRTVLADGWVTGDCVLLILPLFPAVP